MSKEIAFGLESNAKEFLAKARTSRIKLAKLREEIGRLQHDVAVESAAQLKAQKAASVMMQAAATMRRVTESVQEPAYNPHIALAEAYFASSAYAYIRLENTATLRQHSFDVVHMDGEKIATVIAHYVRDRASGEPTHTLFSVAGWKTAEGSPARPFRTLTEALRYVTTLTRVDYASTLATPALTSLPSWVSHGA